MSSRHAIGEFAFEVSFPTEGAAMEEQNRLSWFVKDRLTRIAEKIFDELCPSDHSVSVIDSLAVDLGTISASSYYQEAEDRFRRKFAELLLLKLTGVKSGFANHTDGAARIVARAQSELDIVMHFLDSGSLPWSVGLRTIRPSRVGTSNVSASSADAAGGTSIEEMIRRLIRCSAAEFKRRLRSAAHPDTIFRRMTRQFSSQLLAEIAQVLGAFRDESSRERRVEQTSESSVQEQNASNAAQAYRPQPNVEFSHTAQPFDWEMLLLRAMQAEIAGREPAQPLAESSSRPQSQTQQRNDDENLGLALERALKNADPDFLAPIWPQLLHQPELVADIVRRLGQQSEIRHSLATRFPDSMLRDIAAILQPHAISFIDATMQNPEFLSDTRADRGSPNSIPWTQLWERTLEYLLVERPHNFDRHTYMASLTRQPAPASLEKEPNHSSPDAISPSFIGHRSLASLSYDAKARLPVSLPISPPTEDEAADKPEPIREERLQQPASNKNVSPGQFPGIAQVLRSYELYDYLAAVLLHGEPSHGPLTPALDELRRRHPLQLVRLLRELRTRFSAASPQTLPPLLSLSHHLASDDLHVLNEAFSEFMSTQPLLSSWIATPASNAREFSIETGSPAAEHASHSRIDRPAAPPSPLTTQFAALPAGDSFDDDLSPREVTSALAALNQLTSAQTRHLIGSLDRLLLSPVDWLLRDLHPIVTDPSRLRALIAKLPERQLARILLLVAEAGAHRVLFLAELILDACLATDRTLTPAAGQSIKWQFAFDYLVRLRQPIAEETFLTTFVTHIAKQTAAAQADNVAIRIVQHLRTTNSPRTNLAAGRAIEILEKRFAAPADAEPLGSDTSSSELAPLSAPAPGHASASPSPRTEFRERATGPEQFYVHNAGLVLASPYLPRLFDRLGFLRENQFCDEDAAQRAIHLLQFMADESLQPEEHLLPLNKILCGVDPDFPILRRLDLERSEKEAVHGLLQAIIEHWTAIGKTSVQGLRESFLQREGHLRFTRDSWHLLVQERAFDMLLDRLPWAFRLIKHSWMSFPIHVEWR